MILEKRKTVIYQKPNPTLRARLGKNATIDMLEGSRRIGSAFRYNDTLRGLTFAEEKILLPSIIGVSDNHADWKTMVKDYWCNITIEVPSTQPNGLGGLTLETGFAYEDEDGRIAGNKEEKEQLALYNKALDKNEEYEMTFAVRLKHGRPINPVEFIQYRFLLLHPQVANRATDIYNSAKIEYYIHSQELENKIQHQKLNFRKKAYSYFMELANDSTKSHFVLLLMDREIKALSERKKNIYDLETEMGKEICLEDLAKEYSVKFVAIYEDKDLMDKAFIHECVKHNLLRRISGTDTIMYGDNTLIGYNLNEAVIFLRDDANAGIKQELEAKIKNWQFIDRDAESIKSKLEKQTSPDGNKKPKGSGNPK